MMALGMLPASRTAVNLYSASCASAWPMKNLPQYAAPSANRASAAASSRPAPQEAALDKSGNDSGGEATMQDTARLRLWLDNRLPPCLLLPRWESCYRCRRCRWLARTRGNAGGAKRQSPHRAPYLPAPSSTPARAPFTRESFVYKLFVYKAFLSPAGPAHGMALPPNLAPPTS